MHQDMLYRLQDSTVLTIAISHPTC
uniref:Uncharacterized protein n=1 Tax=Anguilla anguilla TaxID=7936 RepID=A0A0E9QRQ1_ANGAN